ncbi:MAG: flavin reductase family protein [Holophagaceae bacterium]|nr:flavin reductase family protein [Holophagaceae bacterium]
MKKVRLDNRPIGPFPAMIVGATRNTKPTYTTVGAGGCVCLDPVLCVSLKNNHYITDGIAQSGCFSVNIPSCDLIKEMDYCGIISGWDVDKSGMFKPFFDVAGNAPMIEECPLNFLCKVFDSKEICGFTMFFGNIVATYVNDDCLSENQPDPLKINPIIMMAVNYCNLKGVIGRPFSDGKKLMK